MYTILHFLSKKSLGRYWKYTCVFKILEEGRLALNYFLGDFFHHGRFFSFPECARLFAGPAYLRLPITNVILYKKNPPVICRESIKSLYNFKDFEMFVHLWVNFLDQVFSILLSWEFCNCSSLYICQCLNNKFHVISS